MPTTAKSKARKTARAVPAHPDAELFAIVDKCIEIGSRREASMRALEIAESKSRRIPIPADIVKTETDARYRFFVGPQVGMIYGREEIAAIRISRRAIERTTSGTDADVAAYSRAGKILAAWSDWQAACKGEEERAGLAEAERLDLAISDEQDVIMAQLVNVRAKTVDGVVAKARAGEFFICGGDAIDARIEVDLHLHGTDEATISKSLVRDLLALVATTPHPLHL
jgi:hypothetical protein